MASILENATYVGMYFKNRGVNYIAKSMHEKELSVCSLSIVHKTVMRSHAHLANDISWKNECGKSK